MMLHFRGGVAWRCAIPRALNALAEKRATLRLISGLKSRHGGETSNIRLSLSPDRFCFPSFGRRATVVRLGEFDINPRWKPADDRHVLALINRAAASRSIDVDDLSRIHAGYISPRASGRVIM